MHMKLVAHNCSGTLNTSGDCSVLSNVICPTRLQYCSAVQQFLQHHANAHHVTTPAPHAIQQSISPDNMSMTCLWRVITESSSNQGVTLPDLPDLPDLGSAAANIGDSASKAVDIVTGAASKAAESLSAAVSGLTGGVSSKVTDLTSGVGKGAGDVTGQLGGVVSGALDSVKGGLEQVCCAVSIVIRSWDFGSHCRQCLGQ